MKIQFFTTLFILLMFLSCRAQKTAETEQGLTAVEVDVETDPYADGEADPYTDVETDLYADVEAELYANEAILVNEDIVKALEVWTRATSYPFRADSIEHIVYGNGRFVATGYHRIKLAYSDDGDEWIAVQDDVFGSTKMARCITYGNGRFVAAAYGDKIAYSDDGETWALVENTDLGDNYTEGIAYGSGCFVIVGWNRDWANGMIGYSNDGETWTLVEDDSLAIGGLNCITYGNGMFIAGGADGNAVYSHDGKTWTVMPGRPFEDRDVRIITYW
ncbi:MAG: hypothetical protein LBH51_01175 [Treponema sp.]|jgi:hypothetical protein|nr:hypothetical protein [Treponema sp.]